MKRFGKLLKELSRRPRWVTGGMGQRKYKPDGPDFETMPAAATYCQRQARKVTVRVAGRLHMLYPKGQRLCCESDPPHYYDGDACHCWGIDK